METKIEYITLSQLAGRIKGALTQPSFKECWIVAELSDLRYDRRSGHAYCDLIEKDPDTGRNLAKIKGTIWAGRLEWLCKKFSYATGEKLASGMKVLVCVSVNFHAEFGLSLNISDIDPTYTLGDKLRLKAEIVRKLHQAGVYELNRTLTLPSPIQRIAIISAKNAAGYQDFVDQLENNPYNVKFYLSTFQAAMQGVQTAQSVVSAFERIRAKQELFDCVVIIRGGGATTDLDSFLNYDIAHAVATCPLPVICGIGHTRDISVIDEIACVSCKTPTAVADYLITQAHQCLMTILEYFQRLHSLVNLRLSTERERLAHYKSTVPLCVKSIMQRYTASLQNITTRLPLLVSGRLSLELQHLDNIRHTIIPNLISTTIRNERQQISLFETKVELLSPMNVLRRGYTLTRINGKSVRSAECLNSGDVVTTSFADGTASSRIEEIHPISKH